MWSRLWQPQRDEPLWHHRIVMHEVDALGYCQHGQYPLWFESALMEWIHRILGFSYEALTAHEQYLFPIQIMEWHFLTPIRLDDVIVAPTRISVPADGVLDTYSAIIGMHSTQESSESIPCCTSSTPSACSERPILGAVGFLRHVLVDHTRQPTMSWPKFLASAVERSQYTDPGYWLLNPPSLVRLKREVSESLSDWLPNLREIR